MKRFKMPSQRELRAMYPPQNAEFDEAIRTTIRMLPEDEREETQVKKKLSMSLAIAILMILALTCAAVAVGMGVFGKMAEQTKDKGYAQLYQTLDEKSVEVGAVQAAAKNDDGQKVTFKLAQAYVDGNSLFLSYEASGMQSTVDYSWTPTEEERAGMEEADDFMQLDSENTRCDEFVRKMRKEGVRNGGVGAIRYDKYLGDSVYLAGTDEYLNILAGEETIREDGTAIGMKEIELPERLAQEKEISVEFILYSGIGYYFFDGEHGYYSNGGRTEERICVHVPINENEQIQTWHVEKTFETYDAALDVTLTDVKIRVKVNMKSRDGHLIGTEKAKGGKLIGGAVYADGKELSAVLGMDEGLETTDYTMEMEYARPENMPLKLEWVPVYYSEDGKEEEIRMEEAITIELTQ